MISITRNVARQLHAVFRRALNVSTRGLGTRVTFQSGPDGLRVRTQTFDSAAEYHLVGALDDDEIVAPFELLNDCKGAKHDEVKLETTGGRQVIAGWNDGIPQVVQYDPPVQHKKAKFPIGPKKMSENPSILLRALHDAMETADADAVRYSLNHIQLDGGQGRIAATDGKHVLLQSGFKFPWQDQVLIPRRTVFGCKELSADSSVLVGKSGDWMTIRVDPWTFHLRIEKEGRFPAVNDHIQKPDDAVAKLCVSDADADFFLKALKRLPHDDEYNLPVTVDLNGAAVIRAQSDDKQSPTEVRLTLSNVSGESIRANTNRNYLARALRLGFREVLFYGPEAPALCQDGTRNYVWALLGKDGIIKPSKDAICIQSHQEGVQHETTSSHKPRNHPPVPTKSQQNGKPVSNGSKTEESVGVDAIIEHAEALRVSLRDSLAKTSELIVSLKRHKKANKSVQTALASLRQLQTLDA